MLTRRSFLLGLAGSAGAAAVGASYMRWAEPHWIEVSHTKIPVSGHSGAPPLRIAHLSDFHASPVVSFEFIADAVALALAARPDLIALTGDFFTDRAPDADRLAEILSPLAKTAPTFACLGNHDGGPWTSKAGGNRTISEALYVLRAANITCLHNRSAELTLRGRKLQLVGLGDLWSGLCNPAVAFATLPAAAGTTRIVLNHNPDAKEHLRRFAWDVMLCGHTHGGQLRLPLLGTPFAPVVDRRYVQGLHQWEQRWLYITRGVGNLHGLRFNCRPEVSVLELV